MSDRTHPEKWEDKRYTAFHTQFKDECSDGNEFYHWTRYPVDDPTLPPGVRSFSKVTRSYDFDNLEDVRDWIIDYFFDDDEDVPDDEVWVLVKDRTTDQILTFKDIKQLIAIQETTGKEERLRLVIQLIGDMQNGN